jgi:hypothetical protein
MAHPGPTIPGSLRPFDALDVEWALLCRHRRSAASIARPLTAPADPLSLSDQQTPPMLHRVEPG